FCNYGGILGMNIEIRWLMEEIEIIKEKLEDVISTHSWFIDDVFTTDRLKSMEEVQRYGYAYNEHRIHCEQLFDLLYMYTGRLDKKINEFKDIEKASSSADQSKDNAQN
ncbi:type II toxin-antitoxin system toxin TscT, partial [Staphylococcus succinus]